MPCKSDPELLKLARVHFVVSTHRDWERIAPWRLLGAASAACSAARLGRGLAGNLRSEVRRPRNLRRCAAVAVAAGVAGTEVHSPAVGRHRHQMQTRRLLDLQEGHVDAQEQNEHNITDTRKL